MGGAAGIRHPLLPVVIIFTLLAYLLAVSILMGGFPTLLVPVAWVAAAAICGYWHRHRLRHQIDRRQQAKAAFWLAVSFSIPAAVLFLVMMVGVFSTYAGVTTIEAVKQLASDPYILLLPISGIAYFLAFWLIFGCGFMIGHSLANRKA